VQRTVDDMKGPGGLQPRVRIGEARLEGAHPDTEIVVDVLASRHGPGEIRDRVWRLREDGEVEFAPTVDFDLVLREMSGPPPPPPPPLP
jgi:hypothetical protein